jgi:hypothetical protein
MLVALSILTRRINHDEGQYVAAIALARHGWPYLDYAYLQTPLQPILLSELARLPAGWLLVGLRIASGLFGLIALWMLIMALDGRATQRSTMIALAAFICSEPFLFASSLARNDALPMALISATIFALFRGLECRKSRWFAAAGLLLGLASSAKINATVLCVPVVLFLALRARRFGVRSLAAFVMGVVVGLLPTAVLAALAPAQFEFDVFTYSLEAPRQWWTAIGDGGSLQSHIRILRLLLIAFQGCAFVGLVAAAIDRRRSDHLLLLDLLIIGALVAAYLPQPAFTQYMIPLLPPVAARLAMAIDGLPCRFRRAWIPLLAAFSLAGLFQTAKSVAQITTNGNSLANAVAQGRLAAMAAAGQPIVTLSPERVAGSDTALDRGFVTGPFLFRTSGRLGRDAMRLGYSPTWQRVDAALDARQPPVILTGGEPEPHPPFLADGLDAPLASWARHHRYERIGLPGGVTLWERCPTPEIVVHELKFNCRRDVRNSESVAEMKATTQ